MSVFVVSVFVVSVSVFAVSVSVNFVSVSGYLFYYYPLVLSVIIIVSLVPALRAPFVTRPRKW